MPLALNAARLRARAQQAPLRWPALCIAGSVAVLMLVLLVWVLRASTERGAAMRQAWTDASADQEAARHAQRQHLARQQAERLLAVN